ncbi:MAG: Wzz/FepE/Etk N-terminal domain-containing protein [Candidatus Binatia bacterium]
MSELSKNMSFSAEAEIRWREIIATVYRQRRLIATVTVAGTVTVAALTWMQPPIYSAKATIMVRAQRARAVVTSAAGRPQVDRMSDQEVTAVATLLRSQSLVREVLRPHRAALEADEPEPTLAVRAKEIITLPLRVPGVAYRMLHQLPETSPFENWVHKTSARIEVTPIKRSNLIQVSYSSRNPEWAASFVNDLIQLYITRYARMEEMAAGEDFFRNQRNILDHRVADAQAALGAFREKHGVVLDADDETGIREQLGDLEAAVSTEQTKRAELTAREEHLQGLLHDAAIGSEPRVAGSKSVQYLNGRLLELQIERSELLSSYAPTSLFISDIDRQIGETRALKRREERAIIDQMRTETRTDLSVLQARINALDSEIAEGHADLEKISRFEGEQGQLEQELKAARETYVTYLKKEEEARFSRALDESRIVNLNVAEPAEVPIDPEAAHRMETILVGVLLSLALGLGLAFVREQLDPTVKSSAEAERLTGLPVISEIPS